MGTCYCPMGNSPGLISVRNGKQIYYLISYMHVEKTVEKFNLVSIQFSSDL